MLISDHIQAQLEQLDLSLKTQWGPRGLEELLARTVLYGGKRLRPMLLFYAGDFFKIPLSNLQVFASAIEQIHAASLSHDDVIDNGTMRRGRPSINRVGDNKRAVLAGDYLLADVLSTIVDQDYPSIMKETARVIQALAKGEWLQLDLIKERVPTFSQLQEIAINKTGSILGWCLVVPAVLAGLSAPQIDAVREVGHSIGLAFQMIDDSLDFSHASLKDHNADFDNGQINFILCDYFERNPGRRSDFQMNGILEMSSEERIQSQRNIREQALSEIEKAKSLFKKVNQVRWSREGESLFDLFDLFVTRTH